MRSFTLPVAVATLLVASVSAAPAATQSVATTTAASSSSTTASSTKDGIIVVSTSLSCGTTTGTGTSSTATPLIWIPSANHQKACDEASFVESTKEDPITSADWEDCAALYSLWASYNGTFNIGSSGSYDYGDGSGYDVKRAVRQSDEVHYAPILQSGSCTFALHSDDLDKLVALGDVDIKDILQTALNEYSSGSLLAVKGGVNCAVRGSNGDKAALKWQVYYPGA